MIVIYITDARTQYPPTVLTTLGLPIGAIQPYRYRLKWIQLAFRTSRVQFAPPPDPPADESRSAVGGGGDGEQVEDLLLQRVEFRFEGLHVCTVAA
jgi:hypothetical protein